MEGKYSAKTKFGENFSERGCVFNVEFSVCNIKNDFFPRRVFVEPEAYFSCVYCNNTKVVLVNGLRMGSGLSNDGVCCIQ